MPHTVLVTLGRLPKGLELARAFARAGHRVVVADPMRRHLSSVSRCVARHTRPTAPTVDRERYLADLLAVVRREAVDLILPVSEEILYAAALREQLPPMVRFFGPDQAVLLAVNDKLAFARRAAELGLGAPESVPVGTAAAEELAARYPVVSKPRFGCAGWGFRAHRAGALPRDLPTDHLLQRRIEGRHLSSFTIANAGRVVATVLYEGRIFSGASAVAFARVEHEPTAHWIEQFVAAECWSGFIAFDFIVEPDGRVIAIECNPRTTSGIHFLTPEAVVAAILTPEDAEPAFRPEPVMQEFWSCLTAAYAHFGRPRRFAAALRELADMRDVTWDRQDPWVFPLMTFTSWSFIWASIRTGKPFGVTAMQDVAWLAPQPRADGDAVAAH